MTAAPQWSNVSEADYLAGELTAEIRHEFIGGEIYAMAGGNNRHNLIATNAVGILHSLLRGNSCRAYNSDTKVRVQMQDHTRYYYPDALVVCDQNPEDDSFQDQPVIVIEVLSDSTRRTDLGEKRDAYLTLPSLASYLIIEQDQPRVTVHRRIPDKANFERKVYDGLETSIPLPEIDAALALADLFEGLD